MHPTLFEEIGLNALFLMMVSSVDDAICGAEGFAHLQFARIASLKLYILHVRTAHVHK